MDDSISCSEISAAFRLLIRFKVILLLLFLGSPLLPNLLYVGDDVPDCLPPLLLAVRVWDGSGDDSHRDPSLHPRGAMEEEASILLTTRR